MNPILLDQTILALKREATHSMAADVLHRRMVLATGQHIPFQRFLDALRQRPERFAIIAAGPPVADQSAWTQTERADYALAWFCAGTHVPIVTLTERPTDPLFPPAATESTSTVLTDVHDALASLLCGTAAMDDE